MSKRKVIVIGGGFAGLAATSSLCQSGGKFQVDLLEASDLLGGRVRTTTKTSVPIALGATYFHGEKSNSLLDLAYEHGILKRGEGRDYPGSDEKTLHLLSDGTRLPESAVASYEEIFREILDEDDEEEENKSGQVESRSLCEVVIEDFQEEASEGEKIDFPPGYSKMSLLENFLYNEGIMEGSKRLEDIDVARYEDYTWDDTSYDFYFDGNPMQNLVDFIVKQIPEESLHVRCEVTSIVWNQQQQPHPITVHCTNGEQYSADHVITTVSLGVLKSKSNTPFFTPPLPKDKQEAIACLGYGTVNKVVLEFSKPFMEDDIDGIHIYYKSKQSTDKHSWLQGLHRFHLIPNKSVLTVWLAGDNAVAIESLSESELADGICRVLESALGRSIPSPAVVVASRWHSDPHFCGSYSYPALGTTEPQRSILGAPVDGNTPLQLLFAGEATHSSLFSTANAAYDTGITAAKTIINFVG